MSTNRISCTPFTALHWMQGGLVTRKLSVRPSVWLWMNEWKCSDLKCIRKPTRGRLSLTHLTVCQTRALWQGLSRFLYHTKDHSLIFWEEEWLVGATPSTWNFGSTGSRWSEIAEFLSIFARSASAVAPSKISSINTNRNRQCTFQWA